MSDETLAPEPVLPTSSLPLPSMFDLRGRVAVVTGAGGGLGRAYALALSATGAHVACADKDASAAESTSAAIVAGGGLADAFAVDVSDDASVAAFASAALHKHSRVDVLVNNAGITSLPMRTHEVSLSDWDRVMNINVRGAFLCSRAFIPAMLAAGSLAGGSIINIASIIGLVGVYPGFAISGVPYASSKAAIVGLTRQMAVEYARDNIRANVIAPGWHGGTNLGRERRLLAIPGDIERFERHITDSVPMGRRGKPEDMDGLVVYLSSDASRYVTGQVFAHDGGLTAA